jgi:Ca2+-binding RTX toxin-like protein
VIAFENGVLTLTGGSGNDVITLSKSASGKLVAAVTLRDANNNPTGPGEFRIFQPGEVKKLVIDGKDGNDLLSNLTDVPCTVLGGGGNDVIYGGSQGDSLVGGDGTDLIAGRNGNDTIDGGDGGDFLYGEAGDDCIAGGGGNDWMYGGDGNDTMKGGGGNDVINPGPGNNKVTQ